MSADLELRLPTVKIDNSSSDFGRIEDDEDEEIYRSGGDCRTPRSPRHMIPAVLRCPPAPKKRRRSAACKRRICELQFFEVVARDEVDLLFGIVEVSSCNRSSTKRNCFL